MNQPAICHVKVQSPDRLRTGDECFDMSNWDAQYDWKWHVLRCLQDGFDVTLSWEPWQA